MEDLNSVKEIDTATHKVTGTWPAAPCEAATGMAFDIATHRLFLGCDNKLMVMMDSANGKVIYSVPVGNGDAGTVTVAHEDSASMLKVVQTLKTKPGARTMTLDPVTHRIYLAATDYEPRAPGSKDRPRAVVGTFRVLVYEMK
jgi:DNA-binding beta-propeller fold protein YncE